MMHSERKDRLSSVAGYLAVVIAAAALILFSGASDLSHAAPEQMDRDESPIALVNGIPIYPSDFNCALEAWNFSSSNGSGASRSVLLNRLIVIELLYQESLKHRFQGLAGDAEGVFRREVKRAGSEEKLRSTLQCNNISLQQFRRHIFRNLAINRLLDQMVYSKISVSEDEVEEYYAANKDKFRVPESVRLRQIIIKFPHTTDEKTLLEVKNKARYIFKKAVKGNDFMMLARKYSDDPSSASTGGEMGVIYRGNFHHEFESVIFSHGEGTVTEPVQFPGGFRIFQVVSISPSVSKPLDQVRSEIITHFRKSKARIMISEYISSLKENAEIRILREDYGN